MTEDVYGAQGFIRDGRGWQYGAFVPCPTADAARSEARRLAASRDVTGAVAFLRRNYSREFCEGDDPITIEAFGDVPEEARDTLPF